MAAPIALTHDRLAALAASHPADLDLWAASAARTLGRCPATGRRWARELALEGDSREARVLLLRSVAGGV